MAESARPVAAPTSKLAALAINIASALAIRLASALGAMVQRAIDIVPRYSKKRPEDKTINSYALLQAYVLMAVTGLGYLALTWSTVVLLGGFVASLGKKDFWCLTGITMVQAARIFNDLGDNLFPIFMNLTGKLGSKVFANPVKREHPREQVFMVLVQIICMPVLVVVLTAGIVYAFGPLACILFSIWRLRQHDYGNTAGDGSKANLVPALIIFYGMVIFQGVLYHLWWLINLAVMWVVVSFRDACKLPQEWGIRAVVDYIYDTRAKCWRDPASIHGRKVITYAVELVDSESQEDYLSGARMLATFIKLEADVRPLLLPSRPKIQKLIDTLGWRSGDRDLREAVARIVAHLAGDIHLSQFPGAIRCISSLLDTTLPYWNNQQGEDHHRPKPKQDINPAKERLISYVKGIDKRLSKNKHRTKHAIQQDGVDSNGDVWNELILQGLVILERLAFDPHNCRDICSTPDLLPKIMAPLYSNTLIQDINVSAWADVANGSLRVVHRLICAPEWIGKRLAHEISSSKQALSNMESFLDQGNNVGTELQMRAIEILTQLAFDSSANLCRGIKENLIKKLLQIFLTGHEGGEEQLRVTAGKSLALLSRIKTITVLIVMAQNNILDRLSEVLDAKNNITYRTVALEILENLCIHCTLDKDYVKEALLPKVLMVMVKRHGENQAISGPGDDEEKQVVSKHSSQIKSPDQANEKQKSRFQEALLSLTFVMCVSANDFDDVARGAFVKKLKAIVEQNCKARADCLRVVKLCGQIAVSMLQRGHVTVDLEQCVKSLCKASEIMSNLESCMLFAGTDCGVKKIARPLLSDVAKKARQLVGN